jgi:hypothetical protein
MVPAFAYRRTRLVVAALLASSCTPAEERPGYRSTAEDAGVQEEGGIRRFEAGPPPVDGAGYCGNLLIPVILERPNVYFIMDRSGSMEEPVDRYYNRYTTARMAIGEVLRAIGHRISYGAAVLPAFHNPDNCATGKQVFAATQGDPIAADRTQNGPTLQTFLRLLASYPPSGNTPVAATLVALTPTLLALPGRTVAILATDGGPNCNLDARCSAAGCIPNIEGRNPCTGDFNCCDPANVQNGPVLCVDEDATIDALENLAQHDVSTYVVGLPGSNVYADVLNRFAVAGQTAREGATRYYAADDKPELTGALREILGSVAISCDIALDATPPNSSLVNVYFDQRVIPLNAAHGWSWLDDRTLRIQGSRCEELKSGDVGQVQVLSGCTTLVE